MQSIKAWFVRHGRLAIAGGILILLFVLIRTVFGFLLNVSPNVQVEAPVPTGQPADLMTLATVQPTAVPLTPVPSGTPATWPTPIPTSGIRSLWQSLVWVVFVEIAVGIIAGVVAGILLSVVTFTLRRPSPLIQVLKTRIGSEEFQVDTGGDIDKTTRLLEKTIINMQELPRVFLSHSSDDSEFARHLTEDLRSQAIEVELWLPEQEMKPGDLIDKRVRQGIEDSQWFLVIVSPSALESDWVHKELAFALQAEKARDRTFVVPILYKGDDVFAALGDREYIDFRTGYQGALRRLAERLIASMRGTAKGEMIVPLDDALLALDRGEIDEGEAEAITQSFALGKWLQGDTTGWYELWEQVRFGDGLHPVVRSAIKRELGQVQQGAPRSGIRPGYEERLRSLLSPQSVE